MQAMVRDDLIAIETFVALRFKYEKYIEMIYDCGGYCFVDQFIKYFGGKSKGRYLVEQLEKSRLIKTKFFNNYKYCYLTDASIKYVKYKDDPRDFSEMKKANIPIKKITPNPTEKVLFSSALKFALVQRYPSMRKRSFIKICENIFSGLYSNKLNKDELVKNAVKRTIDYYDNSKIIFAIATKKLTLQMVILASGEQKSVKDYINLLKKYLDAININFKNIIIIPFSCTKEESIKIKEEFDKKLKERQETIDMNRRNYRTMPELYLEEMLEKDNIIPPKYTCVCLSDDLYIGNYKNQVSNNTNYIKPKDIDRFEKIKNNLKNKSEYNKSVNKNVKKKNYKDDKKIEDDEKFLRDLINKLRN